MPNLSGERLRACIMQDMAGRGPAQSD